MADFSPGSVVLGLQQQRRRLGQETPRRVDENPLGPRQMYLVNIKEELRRQNYSNTSLEQELNKQRLNSRNTTLPTLEVKQLDPNTDNMTNNYYIDIKKSQSKYGRKM